MTRNASGMPSMDYSVPTSICQLPGMESFCHVITILDQGCILVSRLIQNLNGLRQNNFDTSDLGVSDIFEIYYVVVHSMYQRDTEI
jgi:hypothetical protein